MLRNLEPRVVVLIVASLLLAGVVASCASLDMGDVVKVRTPTRVQQQMGLPSTLSLNESTTEYANWYDSVQRDGAQWRAGIERGEELRGLLNQLALGFLNDAGPVVAGVPIAGPGLVALTGILATMLGAGHTRREKEKSYNAGIELGRGILGTSVASDHRPLGAAVGGTGEESTGGQAASGTQAGGAGAAAGGAGEVAQESGA